MLTAPPSSACCLSPSTRHDRRVSRPAACRLHPALARRWRGWGAPGGAGHPGRSRAGRAPGGAARGVRAEHGVGAVGGGKSRCRVGRAVTQPGPSPDPD
jgi:hypothetical protein